MASDFSMMEDAVQVENCVEIPKEENATSEDVAGSKRADSTCHNEDAIQPCRNSLELPELVIWHLLQEELHRLSVSALCAAHTNVNEFEQQYVDFRDFIFTRLVCVDCDRRQLIRHTWALTYLLLRRAGLKLAAQNFYLKYAGDLLCDDLEMFTHQVVLNETIPCTSSDHIGDCTSDIPWRLSLPMFVAQQLRAYFSKCDQFLLYHSLRYCTLRTGPCHELQPATSCNEPGGLGTSNCQMSDSSAKSGRDASEPSGDSALINGSSLPAPKKLCRKRNGYHDAVSPGLVVNGDIPSQSCCVDHRSRGTAVSNGAHTAESLGAMSSAEFSPRPAHDWSQVNGQNAHARPPPSLSEKSQPVHCSAELPSSSKGPARIKVENDSSGTSSESFQNYEAESILRQAEECVELCRRPDLSFALFTVQAPAPSSFHVCSSALPSSGSVLACGCSDSSVRLQEVALPARPDMKLEASMTDDSPRRCSAKSASQPSVLRGHRKAVYSCRFCPDESLLATSSSDGSVRLWSVETREQIASSPQMTGSIWDVTCPDQLEAPAFLLSSSSSGIANLWHIDEASRCLRQLRCFTGHQDDVNVARFHPNCAYIATGSSDGVVLCHDLASGKATRTLLAAPRSPVRSLVFSRCGRYLVSASDLGVLSVFDIGTGRLLTGVSYAHTGSVHSLDFVPGSDTVLSTGADGNVCAWSVGELTYFAAGSRQSSMPEKKATRKWHFINARKEGTAFHQRIPCSADVTPYGTQCLANNVVAVHGVSTYIASE